MIPYEDFEVIQEAWTEWNESRDSEQKMQRKNRGFEFMSNSNDKWYFLKS